MTDDHGKPAAPAAAPAPATPRGACGNCGTPLLGGHCYACGQPVKGLVRHFSSIVGDFFDSVFDFDARTPRTLWPLLAKPGYLSAEYFAGRRVRYVSPVRLFFFLAIVTFFFAQLTVSFGENAINFGDGDAIGVSDADAIGRADNVEEVGRLRDAALAQIGQAQENRVREQRIGPDAALITAEVAVRKRAAERIAELQEADQPGKPARERYGISQDSGNQPDISFNGRPWHPEDNPLEVAWLPGFANAWLNTQVGRTQKNIVRLQDDPDLFKDALLGAVPSTLFVLLPLFALMLKVLYLFKRRLYMEHLIVALHSHAFLCLALLLMFLVMALQRWLAPSAGALHVAFDLVEAGLWIWMPLYLLLMQKRVYAQGWPMTLFKYSVLGFCYLVLLSFGAAFTVLASLVWM